MPKKLKEMKPGSRIVSHVFDTCNWKSDKRVSVHVPIRKDISWIKWKIRFNKYRNPASEPDLLLEDLVLF